MSRALRRAAFIVFAIVLFTLTHWPRLELPSAVPRSDLIVHVGAFALWTWLCMSAAFFGTALSARNVLRSAILGALVASIDELSQGIPMLHRTVALSDWLANLAGVALATIVALVIARRTRMPMVEP